MSNPTIVIPYRNRLRHLQQFLPYYRKLLPAATFLVVEQTMTKEFNRGKLFNIGFHISKGESDYFVFHDVDMLIQGKPDYSFPGSPVHCATNASQFNWQMPFPEYFGGVTIFNKQDFEACNGYPNSFWGWGGEDNSMYYTVINKGLSINQRPHRYLSLPHPKANSSGFDAKKMEQAKKPRAEDDGLNNMNYRIVAEREIQNGRIITIEI